MGFEVVELDGHLEQGALGFWTVVPERMEHAHQLDGGVGFIAADFCCPCRVSQEGKVNRERTGDESVGAQAFGGFMEEFTQDGPCVFGWAKVGW